MCRATLLILVFAACNGPSLDMRGGTASQVDLDGHSFNVFIRDGRAEAVRTNFVKRRDLGQVYVSAARAMEAASDCRVIDKSMRGDPAQMWARLDCRDRPLQNEIACDLDRTNHRRIGDLVAACDDVSGARTVVTLKK